MKGGVVLRWRLVFLAIGILVCMAAIGVILPVMDKAARRFTTDADSLAAGMQAAKVAAGVLIAMLLACPLRRRDALYVLLFHSVPAAVLGLPPVGLWLVWRGTGFPWNPIEHPQVLTIAAVWLGASLVSSSRAGTRSA